MRILFLLILTLGIITSCQSGNKQTGKSVPPGFHKVLVQEVIHTTNYTYLHVKENDSLLWLAVPLMEAKEGETYYYENGMRMTDFQSKELNRTFDAVYFLAGVSKEPVSVKEQAQAKAQAAPSDPTVAMDSSADGSKRSLAEPHGSQVSEKKALKIEPAKGGITIAKLFGNKESYSNKTVKVKGEVTKINPGIMNRNWIHIQDGTAFGDKYDLTVTTELELKVGDVVTFEGKIALNKDFGFGYFYNVIMEEAVLK